MKSLDDRVEEAQEAIADVAEPGSMLDSVIDLLDELYALVIDQHCGGEYKPSEARVRMGKAMASRAALRALNQR